MAPLSKGVGILQHVLLGMLNLLAAKFSFEAISGVRNATYGANMLCEDWVDSDAVYPTRES